LRIAYCYESPDGTGSYTRMKSLRTMPDVSRFETD
jgi:hypothetical protein